MPVSEYCFPMQNHMFSPTLTHCLLFIFLQYAGKLLMQGEFFSLFHNTFVNVLPPLIFISLLFYIFRANVDGNIPQNLSRIRQKII